MRQNVRLEVEKIEKVMITYIMTQQIAAQVSHAGGHMMYVHVTHALCRYWYQRDDAGDEGALAEGPPGDAGWGEAAQGEHRCVLAWQGLVWMRNFDKGLP